MVFSNHQDTKTPSFNTIPTELDILGKSIVDCAFQVHSNLGASLLESIYEEAYIFELKAKGISFEQQKTIQIPYKGHFLMNTYRLDLLIEKQIIIELKCVDKILPLHEAQLLTYLKLTSLRLGYLINVNSPLIKDGIKRKVL